MTIDIKEVENKKDLRTFIFLPEKIHADHKQWLPPLYMDEWKLFSPDKNTSFEHCTTIRLLAYEGTTPVGRIMGLIQHNYNQIHKQNSARFAFFECYESQEVFNALIKYVEQWALGHGCQDIIGPMGFSDKDPQGFLTSGFGEETMMVTNCSLPFMKDFIEAEGYRPYVHLYQYDVPLTRDVAKHYKPFAQRVEERNGIHVLEFTSTHAVKPYIQPVFELINKTYRDIYGFSTLSDVEIKEFSTRFLPLLNARLIKIITNCEGEVIAFVVAMADLSKGIKKAGGRLFPSGWFHLLRAAGKSKRLVLLLGAISVEMRNKGLDAVLGDRLLRSAIKIGFTSLDSHLIMKDNYKMRREIERMEGHRLYKTYGIYSKVLEKKGD